MLFKQDSNQITSMYKINNISTVIWSMVKLVSAFLLKNSISNRKNSTKVMTSKKEKKEY